MENDLMDVIDAVLAGQLDQLELRFKPGAALCLVLASGGYPVSYQTGFPIAGLEEADAQPDTVVFHAGHQGAGGWIVTAGGRVLGVTAPGGIPCPQRWTRRTPRPTISTLKTCIFAPISARNKGAKAAANGCGFCDSVKVFTALPSRSCMV